MFCCGNSATVSGAKLKEVCAEEREEDEDEEEEAEEEEEERGGERGTPAPGRDKAGPP